LLSSYKKYLPGGSNVDKKIIGGVSEGSVIDSDRSRSKKAHKGKNVLVKSLFGIIGVLIFSLLIVADLWTKNYTELTRKTNSLNYLANEFQRVRTENEIINKIKKDRNYYEYLKAIYEQRDGDFFETARLAYDISMEKGMNPFLTMSIIHRESAFNQFAQSNCAFGLMQINFEAWKDMRGLDRSKIFDKRYNISHGLEIYKYYLRMANYDPWLALFYYNNGEAADPETANKAYPGVVMNSKFMKPSQTPIINK
jgi:hypothetical protein